MLACGALTIMLVVQLMLPPSAPPSQPSGLAPRRQRPVVVPPVPEYAAILASPIFAPDRHPGASGDLSQAGGGSLSGYAAVGAVASAANATAVITVPGGGIKTVRRGDEVDGWRLVGVDKTRVYFEHNGVRHSLVIGAPPEAAAAQPGAGPGAGDGTPQAATP
jgi:general secretion pathway protein N